MKTFRIVLAAMLVMIAATVSAQTPLCSVTGPATYDVVLHDTVWGLNNNGVAQMEAANPYLAGRHFSSKQVSYGLLIRPGDKLEVPAGLTIYVPCKSGVTPTPVPAGSAPVLLATTDPGLTWADLTKFGWIMGLVLVVVILLALYLMWEWLNGQNRQMTNIMRAVERNYQGILNSNRAHARRLIQILDEHHHDRAVSDSVIGTLIEMMMQQIRGQRSQMAYEFRRLRREVNDNSRASGTAPSRPVSVERGNPVVYDSISFIEVHQNGQTTSLLVSHGSTLTPQADGVAINGRATVLTVDAAVAQRRAHNEAATERSFAAV